MPRALSGLLLFVATAAAPAAEWKSVVDPPADKVEWPAAVALDAPVPKSFFDPDLAFAEHGGAYAIAGRNGRNESRVVIDLRTGKPVAVLAGEYKIEAPAALSRDGRLFATFAQGFQGNGLVVLDFGGKKVAPVAQIAVDKKPDAVGFAGPDKVVVYTDKKTVQVFEAKGGKELFEATVERSPWRHAVPVGTPGGKYVAVPDAKRLRFLDAATGNPVADFALPTDNGQDQNLDGAAVSPDGARLAVLLERFGKRRLAVVDLATGAVSSDNPIDPPANQFYPGPRLAWTADSAGLLYFGGATVDPATGKTVFAVPNEGKGARYALSLGSVVLLTADRDNRRLKTVGLSADKVAAAQAAVRSGGSAADALLPPLAPVSVLGAKAVDVPLTAVPWAAKPDPAPGAAGVAAQPIPVVFPLTGLQSVRVVGGAKPAAVFETSAGDTFGRADPTRPRQVRRIDLATGRVTADLEIPPGVGVVDAAADGSAVLTTDVATGTRVDLFPLEKGAKPVGLRPFDKEKVRFAAILGGGRVLTASADGKVSVWELPAGKAVYVADVPGLTVTGLTPGRGLVVGVQGQSVRFLHAATGAPVGDLRLPFPIRFDANNPPEVAVSPAGTEAAAVLFGPAGTKVVRWDLTVGGNPVAADPLPPGVAGSAKPAFAGNDLLLGGRDLYDPARKAVVWRFVLNFGGTFAAQRPDGRAWYVAPGAAGGTAALVAADLPGKAVEDMVSAVTDGPGGVLRPGVKVSATFEFAGTNAADAQKKAADECKKAWAEKGITLEDGAPVQVRVVVTERDTGERMEFTTSRGFIPPSPFARPTDIARTMEVTIQTTVSRNGQVVWTAPPAKHNNHLSRFTLPKDEKTVDGYLIREMWNKVPGWAAATVPAFLTVTPGGAKTLPGESQLTAAGWR